METIPVSRMLSRCVTSLLINLVGKNSRIPRQIERCQFHVTKVARWKKKNNEFKIIRPAICDDSQKPIMDPVCKNALVVGGADGFGFAAANHLLCKGAKRVILADDNVEKGTMRARKLCESYGKDRAQFLECDIRNLCQFEASLTEARNRFKIIHIVFNNLDKEMVPLKYLDPKKKSKNFATRTTRVALKLLGKKYGGSGGVIINCASIFGFIGWPHDPFPIYCRKEPVIEVTIDFALENNVNDTGVRIVSLCPTNKLFHEIGLPPFPEPITNRANIPPCIPRRKMQIGPAICYVLAWAKNGSVWLVEPAFSVHRIPFLIHFPLKEGEKIDPKVYEEQICPVKFKSDCVRGSSACTKCKIKKKWKKK